MTTPTLTASTPSIVDAAGGTVVLLAGTNFLTPMTIDVLLASAVVGSGLLDNEITDLTPTTAYVGLPRLAEGLYDLRVTTPGGSVTLANALDVRAFAYEYKVESVRRKWARVWATGLRILGQ